MARDRQEIHRDAGHCSTTVQSSRVAANPLGKRCRRGDGASAGGRGNQAYGLAVKCCVANEEVTVPAGTFKTFKVRYTDSVGIESVNWYSPDGAGWVKIGATRDGRFPAGPGTQDFDLLSYSIKKN